MLKPNSQCISARLAEAINVHLKRFEADPKINTRIGGAQGIALYYGARAVAINGGRIRMTYVAYQPPTCMVIAEAERYLAWLRAGNVGQHHDCVAEARALEALKLLAGGTVPGWMFGMDLMRGRRAEQLRRGAVWARAWAAREPEARARVLSGLARDFELMAHEKQKRSERERRS